jgi:hypothetical protein
LFSFRSFVTLIFWLQDQVITQGRGLEQLVPLMDIIWPVYEEGRYYNGTLAAFFKREMGIMHVLGSMAGDRGFGQFFKVSFWGPCFGASAGNSFVFHEPG